MDAHYTESLRFLYDMNHLKETYFTPASINLKSAEMKRALEGLSRKKPVLFSPSGSALLVLDMQSYFLAEASHAFVPSATAILPRVNSLIAAFTGKGLPVILSKHVNSIADARSMGTWWREIITADNPLSEIDPRIDFKRGITFCKTQYDAFLYSPLE
jgi:isochorismate hydrolase